MPSNLPPGCGILPGGEPESPCAICGEIADNCNCECSECGAFSCMAHLEDQALMGMLELIEYRRTELWKEWEKRKAFECPGCERGITPPVNGDPAFCHDCLWSQAEVEGRAMQ